MQPNDSQVPQPANTNLPPTQAMPVTTDLWLNTTESHGTANASTETSRQEAAVLQAKQLLTQYQQSPYELSEAMSQLKTRYVFDQYGVHVNSAGN